MTQTIEQTVAITVLEQHIGELVVDGESYKIPAPTTATLIAVSGLISQLPVIATDISDDQLLAEVLASASRCGVIGHIAATLVLGAKRIAKDVKVADGKRKYPWQRRKTISEVDKLAGQLLEGCTATQMLDIVNAVLREAGIANFFVLTTFLRAKNLLSPTREVATTQSGHSSSAGPNTFR